MSNQKDIDQKKFYSELKYPGPRSSLTYLWAKRMSKYFKSNQEFTILDAGCGSGNDLCAILDYFKNCKGIGIDQSKPSLDMLKKRSDIMRLSNRLKIVNQSYLEDFTIEDKADIAIAIGTIGHSSNPDLALKNILKNIKKGGLVGLMLYSDFGTYEKNKIIDAINILSPKSDDEFLKLVYSFEEKYPKYYYQSIHKNITRVKNFISHYIRRLFRNKSYGYLASLPKDTIYKDAYITKIEKSFSFEDIENLLESNNLEIIEFYSLGKINKKDIPKKWIEKWENLSYLDKAKVSSLINFNPTSWSVMTRKKSD